MNDAIVVDNLGKRFRRFHADRPGTLHEALMRGFGRLTPSDSFWGLRHVSFRVAPGRMAGVIGRNGAGKSTLLRLVGGVGRPDEGKVRLRGKVGALLSLGAGFHPDLSGMENLFTAGVVAGLTRQEVRARLDSIVAFSELEGYLEAPLRAYSTGMQMRLAFSIAIHAQPDILLIDEVLAVGDIAFQGKCLRRIAELKSQGCAILLVSHEAAMIQELCDDCLWLRKGGVEEYGPAAEVAQRYLEECVTATGLSTAGGDAAQPAAKEAGSRRVEIRGVRLFDPDGNPTSTIESGEPLTLEIAYRALRPTALLNFQVQIHREDGLHCCDICTRTSITSLADVSGDGAMRLHLEQVNLNGGLYYVDVCAFEHDGASSYDNRTRIAEFTVRRTVTDFGILRPPHRWETDPAPAQRNQVAAKRLAS